jgi:endonuclease/exonuclease/phosphatase (EEP) superfamily protein YafD
MASFPSLLRGCSIVGTLVYAGATAASALASWHWLPELLTHFRAQASSAGVALVLACVTLRLRTTAVIATCALAAQLVPLLSHGWSLEDLEPALPGPRLRVATINVHTANRDHAAVVESVLAWSPDIVGLIEVDQGWLEALAPLHEKYPYRVERPQDDNFGIALFSRFPLQTELRPLLHERVSFILGHFTLASEPITVAFAHPVPPSSKRSSRLRDRQLEELARVRREFAAREFILAGDLNVTPFSPAYRDLVSATALRSASRGRGYLPTWPTHLPGLMIPIDHCLLSEGLRATGFEVGGPIGSDHLPVLTEIAVSRRLRPLGAWRSE